jgi:hypothetical protein
MTPTSSRPFARAHRVRTFLIFGGIEGKLDVLNVECTKCARKGRYHVQRLVTALRAALARAY